MVRPLSFCFPVDGVRAGMVGRGSEVRGLTSEHCGECRMPSVGSSGENAVFSGIWSRLGRRAEAGWERIPSVFVLHDPVSQEDRTVLRNDSSDSEGALAGIRTTVVAITE